MIEVRNTLIHVATCALLGAAPIARSAPAVGAVASKAESAAPTTPATPASIAAAAAPELFAVEDRLSEGSVTIGGRRIDYQAHAGTLVVHGRGWDDVPQNADKDAKVPPAEASMFYTAYFAKNPGAGARPVTFLFNGGPGSSTIWLHMGAFGPKRVLTPGDTHPGAAPYTVVNNEYSLLDASDLVFVDAPGTGYSRISGKDREKEFFTIDGDAHAFAEFIQQFLSKYGRWNSPKFLFGESYGTTRVARLIAMLETEKFIDFNGVVNLSQIEIFDANADTAESNPGVDLPYLVALPSYAATAWYHHRTTNAPATLPALLAEVEQFAMHDYALALLAGSTLDAATRHAIASKLHDYTGLPVDYIEKADLRIDVGEFAQNLRADGEATVGRLDTRFTGPTIDLLSKEADYDPQFAAVGSAYVSAFNDYARGTLGFAPDRSFRPLPAEINKAWTATSEHVSLLRVKAPNLLPDLATAMKYNPRLKLMLNAGYYDLATPYYEGVYELNHLPIPDQLRANIETKFYESGHMVYAHEPSLKALHANVADFIRRASQPN
ncbi:MAG: peptidase S10 [Gammaproteobacteria bacterium]|nr:peptidase S10 [Gammaproteobacteria bacterium]